MSRAPLAFVSHGAPTVALENDAYHAALRAFGARAPAPRAIAVVSAHWLTRGAVAVTGARRHRVIHDFAGFPAELYRLDYAAPGDPALAEEAVRLLAAAGLPAGVDPDRGLDHGAWVPLQIAWPAANVPVVQLSLPADEEPLALHALGRALAPLRERGVLILGSGGLVHNLGQLRWGEKDRAPEPWAAAFDAWMAARLAAGDVEALLRYRERAPHAVRAAPTTEHLDPLFVALGAAAPAERAATIFEGFHYGSLGMRSIELREAA